MNTDLQAAYENTSYNVFDPPVSIRIGHRNTELDALLERRSHEEWAFITAYNPFSEILSDLENEERHHQLRKQIEQHSFFEGEGVGTNQSWKPERSFLILGISETDAVKLGEDFQQNAIVVGRRKGQARLVLLK